MTLPIISGSVFRTFIFKENSVEEFGPKYNYLKRAESVIPPELAKFPPRLSLPHEQIASLIRPETWALWDKAKHANNVYEKENLLEQIQCQVYEDIMNSTAVFEAAIGDVIIVRSNSVEDRKGKPYAGVNKTVPDVAPTPEDVKKAVAEVVASYFNMHILEDASIEVPLCSVLLMEQIVEKGGKAIASGVIMSSKPGWGKGFCHIVSSFGFGAGVSTRSVCDEFVCTNDHIYKTIRPKYTRVALDRSISNAKEYQTTSSLTDETLAKLQKIAQLLEEELQDVADIEFVISSDGEIFITQLRTHDEPPLSSAPTFIDPSLPENATVIEGRTILPGVSEALTVSDRKELLCSHTLKDADAALKGEKEIINRVFEHSSTHDVVNIANHRPPICVIAPKDPNDFETIKTSSSMLYLCPQSGRIVLSDQPVSIREGFYLHPRSIPISIGSGKAVHGESQHSHILQTIRYLTAPPEEVLIHIDEIDSLLKELFVEIEARGISFYKEVAQLLEATVKQEIEMIRAFQHDPVAVAFHSGVLRQLMTQNSRIVGSHSVSGLEASTKIAPEILACNSPVAFFARYAFDDNIRDHYLAFITSLSVEEESALLTRLEKLEMADLLTPWLSFYFSYDSRWPFSALMNESTIELFYQSINENIDLLTDKLSLATSEESFFAIWADIEELTTTFFQSLPKQRSSFDRYLLADLFAPLIDLWDGAIKQIPQVHSFSAVRMEEIWAQYVLRFEKLADTASIHKLVDRSVVYSLLLNIKRQWEPNSFSRSFDVKEWVYPFYAVENYHKIRTYNERLSILHQNLMVLNSYGGEAPIPQELGEAQQILEETIETKAKHGQRASPWHTKYGNKSVTISKHLPLNVHSAEIEISQHKYKKEFHIEFSIERNDNYYSHHLFSLKLLQRIYPHIQLTNQFVKKEGDLKVILVAPDLDTVRIIGVVIDNILLSTLHGALNFYWLFAKKLTASPSRESDDRVLTAMWETYVETEDSHFINCFVNNHTLQEEGPDRLREWAQSSGLLPQILAYIANPPEDVATWQKWHLKRFKKLISEETLP